ncbi:glycosyltransferase family 39 protein [Pleurocapsales cyanobacterium LEGE 06147]|nr:glycosyltransferase family 39 protein [Pleurocapsales cyanobacterium LEGE 06147]
MKLQAIAFVKKWWQSFEKDPRSCWIFSILWLLLINWLAFIWHLGSTGLVDETEPLFAEAARQMTVTGDWITPYFDGNTRFDKPPLIYWLMAIGYNSIGVNEWAVRLPSAIAAIALVVLGFYTLRHFGFATAASTKATQQSERLQRQLWLSAWIGAPLIAFNLHTIVWARTGVSDMLLSSCIGMALFCFFWGYSRKSKVEGLSPEFTSGVYKPHKSQKSKKLFSIPNRWYISFYVLTGLAVLTKGPVGVVLPGLIIFAFLLYAGNFWTVLQEMSIISGGLIFLAIALPWYILVTLKHGSAFINSFFGYHNFQRFTDVVNGHEGPWYFYFPVVLGLFAPWSVYLPYAIARLRFWKPSFWRKQPRQAQLGIFAFFWFVCIFIFFTISVTKLPSYVLPLIPAAAILVALAWSEALTRNQQFKLDRPLLVSIIANVLFLIVLAFGFVFSPNLIGKDPAVPNLDELLAQSGLPWRGGMIWGLTALAIALVLFKRKGWRWLVCINLIGYIAFISFLLIPTSFFIDQTRQLPLREISETIVRVQQPAEELWMIDFKKPSVVFYARRGVHFFKHQKELEAYLARDGGTKIKSPTILILSRAKHINRLGIQPKDYQQLDTKQAYQLIRVPTKVILDRVIVRQPPEVI